MNKNFHTAGGNYIFERSIFHHITDGGKKENRKIFRLMRKIIERQRKGLPVKGDLLINLDYLLYQSYSRGDEPWLYSLNTLNEYYEDEWNYCLPYWQTLNPKSSYYLIIDQYTGQYSIICSKGCTEENLRAIFKG